MVGRGSAGEPDRAHGILGELGNRERRGLQRCRRALEKGRRVRGRTIASSDQHGLLLDLGGAVGHLPATEMGARAGTAAAGASAHAGARARASALWRGGEPQWEGWVAAVAADLVHLSCRRPGEEGDEQPIRRAEVVATGRSGATVRLEDGSSGVVPWDELSWEPLLGAPRLPVGATVVGRVVALTLEGPVISPRAIAPSPWPAIALALPPGSEVVARVEARTPEHLLLRTDRPPRAAAVAEAHALPVDARPGLEVSATVARVNAIGGALVLDDVRPRARAPRPAPGAPTPERRGPRRAASDSRS
jgi:hypothetical protein